MDASCLNEYAHRNEGPEEVLAGTIDRLQNASERKQTRRDVRLRLYDLTEDLKAFPLRLCVSALYLD